MVAVVTFPLHSSNRTEVMKRFAYCSPINPQPSGISDYSEELLPYLAQYAEVVLFVERGIVPTNDQLRRHMEVRYLDELPHLHKRKPFDTVLYHMGNSPTHVEIYELLLQVPGVVVLHDFVLHHFKLWYAATRQGDIERYHAEMARLYGEQGAATARRMARGQLTDRAFGFPLVEDVVEHATGLIGHSDLVVSRVRQIRPDVPVARVPMGVPLPPMIERNAARARLGLSPSVPIWASFGHINPYKRVESVLRALRRFRIWEPEAQYILVGSVSPSYDLQGLVRRLGLEGAVKTTGYVAPNMFTDYVAAANVCLNLRFPSAGETSASVLRLLGAGRPVLVSAIDALDELPDDVCAKVDGGSAEAMQLLAYGRLMSIAPAIAEQLGKNARAYIAREHSLDGSARGYVEFLARLYGWNRLVQERPPLWNVTQEVDTAPRSGERLPPAQARAHPERTVISGGSLIAETAKALDELGVAADDRQVLPDIAASIDDLLGPDRKAQ